MSETRHIPVMLEESLRFLEPRPGKVIADLTLGGGGHSEALLQAGATVIGFDRDPEALERSAARLLPHKDRFTPVHRGFGDFAEALEGLGRPMLDGVLMDLGISSDQLDTPRRGFAHRFEGPLDLRFDPEVGPTAAEWIAEASLGEIEDCLRHHGELRHARGLARALFDASRAGELRTTSQLRELVESRTPVPRREGELARVFQALRIEVNAEMEHLARALAALPSVLNAGGRFVCIAYHSLEDRPVKRMLRDASGRAPRPNRHLPDADRPQPTFRLLTSKALRPTPREIEANPRSRSARLRAAERLG